MRLVLAAAALSVSSAVLADPPKEVMNIIPSGDIKFVPNPNGAGPALAVVWGDPKVPGRMYVIRARFSPGTFSRPHFHPEDRYITVLKGTWWVGSGPKFDKNATTAVPAGSAVVHHAKQIHWDGAKDEEVIVQIIGIGPGTTTRVDETGQPLK